VLGEELINVGINTFHLPSIAHLFYISPFIGLLLPPLSLLFGGGGG
jgi:hypothetical protein